MFKIPRWFRDKKTEKALKESENKRKAIFDQALGLICLLKPDGNVLEVNKLALEFSGIEVSSVLGALFWNTPWWSYSEELQAKIKDAIKKCALGEPSRFEVMYYDKCKNWCYMDFFLRPVKDEKDNVVYLVAVGQDITYFKKVEESLRLDSEVIRKINEGVIYILGNINLIMFTNDRFNEMFGYKDGELCGKYAGALFPPMGQETSEQTYERIVEVLNRRKVWKGELHNIRKNGTTFYSLTSIIPINSATHGKVWVGIYDDITNQKKMKTTEAK